MKETDASATSTEGVQSLLKDVRAWLFEEAQNGYREWDSAAEKWVFTDEMWERGFPETFDLAQRIDAVLALPASPAQELVAGQPKHPVRPAIDQGNLPAWAVAWNEMQRYVDWLEVERDLAASASKENYRLAEKYLDRAEAAERSLDVHGETMRTALQPFAEIGAWLFARPEMPDSEPMVEVLLLNNARYALTRGEFKAAHRALHPDASAAPEAPK